MRPLTYRYGDIIAPHISSDEPLAIQDQHFIHRILDGAPQTDGAAGLAVVAIVEAIRELIRQNRPVSVAYPGGRILTPNLAELPA